MTRTGAGAAQAVRYQELIPMLVNDLQWRQQELAELSALAASCVEAPAAVEGVKSTIGPYPNGHACHRRAAGR